MQPHAHQCFIMMPSGNHGEYQDREREADFIYRSIIGPSIDAAFGDEMHHFREVDYGLPGAISPSIIEHIARSELAIVDLTGNNPNVFFELGVRWALCERKTILMHQLGTVLPFDISNYRSLQYTTTLDGPQLAREKLTEILTEVREHIEEGCDSLVYDSLEDLHVSLPEQIGGARGPRTGAPLMPWEIYWSNIQRLKRLLQNSMKDGLYAPSIIVGITNGGAMLADLLAREVYSTDMPVVSIWADRQHRQHLYFENDLNYGIVEGIRRLGAASKDGLKVLLVDDIVSTGSTHDGAMSFLRQHLPEADVRFLPLYSRNQKYYPLVRESLLWTHPAFGMSDKDAQDLYATGWEKLPYDKEIRAGG